MYCRDFFKFTLICSVFQMLLGSPVMANDVLRCSARNACIQPIDNEKVSGSVSGQEGPADKNDSTDVISNNSDEESDNLDNDNQIGVSVSFDTGTRVKDIQILVTLGSEGAENINSVDSSSEGSKEAEDAKSLGSKSLPGSNGVLEQNMKDRFQAKKDDLTAELIKTFTAIRGLLRSKYSDDVIQKWIDCVKSWELRLGLLEDNGQKIWQIGLVPPITVQNTNLLEKTPLDEAKSNFVEINLINR